MLDEKISSLVIILGVIAVQVALILVLLPTALYLFFGEYSGSEGLEETCFTSAKFIIGSGVPSLFFLNDRLRKPKPDRGVA